MCHYLISFVSCAQIIMAGMCSACSWGVLLCGVGSQEQKGSWVHFGSVSCSRQYAVQLGSWGSPPKPRGPEGAICSIIPWSNSGTRKVERHFPAWQGRKGELHPVRSARGRRRPGFCLTIGVEQRCTMHDLGMSQN